MHSFSGLTLFIYNNCGLHVNNVKGAKSRRSSRQAGVLWAHLLGLFDSLFCGWWMLAMLFGICALAMCRPHVSYNLSTVLHSCHCHILGTSITVCALQINQIMLQCSSPLPKTRCKHWLSPITAGICCCLTVPHITIQVIVCVPCSFTVPHHRCRLPVLWACCWLQSETLVDKDLPQPVSSSIVTTNHAHCFIHEWWCSTSSNQVLPVIVTYMFGGNTALAPQFLSSCSQCTDSWAASKNGLPLWSEKTKGTPGLRTGWHLHKKTCSRSLSSCGTLNWMTDNLSREGEDGQAPGTGNVYATILSDRIVSIMIVTTTFVIS